MAHIKSRARPNQKNDTKTAGRGKFKGSVDESHGEEIIRSIGREGAGSFADRSDELAPLSMLLGEHWDPSGHCPDEDFRSVPATFRRSLVGALHPTLGKARYKKQSMVRQLESDARQLLIWAAARSAGEHPWTGLFPDPAAREPDDAPDPPAPVSRRAR